MEIIVTEPWVASAIPSSLTVCPNDIFMAVCMLANVRPILCRRRSYKKKLSYMSFDEGKFIT